MEKGFGIKNWRKYGFEFLSIFIAVISAFALNNWNENRKDSNSENKILIEISNGLEKDLEDIKLNIGGHQGGIDACEYFRKVLLDKEVESDSVLVHLHYLARDYISIQNIAGYETLKSKGLELIKNDSLRLQIISIYEYDYNTLRKLEEEYFETQFHENYFKDINEAFAPYYFVNDDGQIVGLNKPVKLDEGKRNMLLMYLWKIQMNRAFILKYYSAIEDKIFVTREQINEEIN